MNKTLKFVFGIGLAGALALSTSSEAVQITYDEILFDDTVTPAYLSGYVEMSLSGSTLSIFLQNTSSDAAGNEASIFLTGIGFSLPQGISIVGGSANMGASTAVGFVKPPDGDVSEEWGFDTPPLGSGHFIGLGIYAYNTAISSMEADTTHQFQTGSLGQPDNLNGPDFGLLSGSETGALGAGTEAIRDSLQITLSLAGTVPSDLVSIIDSSPVGLTFGSPNVRNNVPDGGATLLLLGMGMVMIGALRRLRA